MAREIKLRVWNKLKKEFVPQTHLDMKVIIAHIEWRANSIKFTSNDFFEFSEFTGLLDKNGKEIYEGDILESKAFIDIFSWVDGGYTFNKDKNEDVMTVHYPYEIIGNIHENPELLSKPDQGIGAHTHF